MKTEALTESVVTEWQEKGAVKIPQLLDPAELSACREFYDWILAIIKDLLVTSSR